VRRRQHRRDVHVPVGFVGGAQRQALGHRSRPYQSSLEAGSELVETWG
jgi:hypothetical protein